MLVLVLLSTPYASSANAFEASAATV